MTCLATVLIPTHDHGPTIRYTLASALQQSVRELEVFIIGDGVPEEHKALIGELAASDNRVRFFDYPKHARRGEPYRNEVVGQAQGRIVCYLCDRDLWLPCHVENMLRQLERADFSHSLPVQVLADETYRFYATDLALAAHREDMLSVANRVPLSCAAHTLEAYRRLPFGWRTTPDGVETDWYMFQQFLRMEDCLASSGTYPSAITFPSSRRRHWPTERRLAELSAWAERVSDAAERDALVLDILQQSIRMRDGSLAELMELTAERQQRLLDLYASPLWRLRETLVRMPGLSQALRRALRVLRKS